MNFLSRALAFVLFGPSVAWSTTYYISPGGSDTNAGTSSAAPFRTFNFAIPKLQPGDTLVLADGNYTVASSGRLHADCTAGAKHGTATAPITVKAQNERRAALFSDAFRPVVSIRNCSYWIFEGLYTRQVDSSDPATNYNGMNILASESHHLTFRRMLIYGCNRWWNNSALLLDSTTDSLVEESESYFCHRKLFSTGSNRNTFRRNYGNGRQAADVCGPYTTGVCEGSGSRGGAAPPTTADGGIQLAYPGSDNLAENNIMEDTYIGIGVDALGVADRNKMFGNIVSNNFFGYFPNSRGYGVSRTPHDLVMTNNIALDSKYVGVYVRGVDNARVTNLTIIGTKAGTSGVAFQADHSVSDPDSCNASASPCGDGGSSTHVLNSLAVGNAATGWSILTNLQEGGWSINYTNSFANAPNYSPASDAKITNSMSIDPQLGTCRAWIPDTSPMKRKGLSGADIGANVLYRYQNGVLTNQPLWDSVSGSFTCGAIVAGVNDVPGVSCFDVHKRLNVNINGCTFPAGFGGSVPSPDPVPATSTTFKLGQRIQVNNLGPAIVRDTAGGNLLGNQSIGIQGTVAGGPMNALGFVWWHVNYDSGADGWSTEGLLEPVADSIAPTVTILSPVNGTVVRRTVGP
jgi:hypothetical protein